MPVQQHIAFKAGLRLVSLLALGIVFNAVYKNFLWMDDLDEHGPMLYNLKQVQDNSDIIYFGESSNFTTAETDQSTDAISEIVDDVIPERVGTINHGAYHAGMYLPLIKQIDPTSSVKKVIVTMNLRTFSQDVIYNPDEASLQQAARFYQPAPPLTNRLFAALKHYDSKDGHERDREKWHTWTYDTLKGNETHKFEPNTIRRWCEVDKFIDSNGTVDMHKRILADQYIKAYGWQLDSSNPMVKSFDDIVEVCNEKQLDLYFLILPENTEDARAYVGDNLVWLINQNVNWLVNRYGNNAKLINCIHDLPAEAYIDRDKIPQEHYYDFGRRKIASKIIGELTEN